MAKTRKSQTRRRVLVTSLSFTPTATGYLNTCFDLVSILQALANSGQEVQVKKAIVSGNIQTVHSTGPQTAPWTELIFAVGDTDFTSGDGGSELIDAALDARNAGDFEYQIVHHASPILGNMDEISGTHYFQVLNKPKADITGLLQRVSAMLARSALLDYTPVARLMAMTGGTTQPATGHIHLVLDFVLVAKPLRMLA